MSLPELPDGYKWTVRGESNVSTPKAECTRCAVYDVHVVYRGKFLFRDTCYMVCENCERVREIDPDVKEIRL